MRSAGVRGEKKRALEERVAEQAAKRICVEEKYKTPREKSQKKDERAGDDLNVGKKGCRHVHGKKGKRPSEAIIFSAVHATASGTCQKKVEGTMSHNAVILWFI